MAITFENILKLSASKKLIILGVALILVISLFVWLLILPEYRVREQKDQEYNKLKTDLDTKKKVAQDLVKFKAKLEKIKSELEIMKTQLPDKKEIPNLLKTISALGNESGLKFQLFRPMPEIAKEFYAEIPVEIKVVGGYHAVASFFYKVGMLDRIVNITNVDMGKAREEKGEMELNTSCLATTFRFVETAPAPENKAKEVKKGKEQKKKGVSRKKEL